jgi:hypothetical protein
MVNSESDFSSQQQQQQQQTWPSSDETTLKTSTNNNVVTNGDVVKDSGVDDDDRSKSKEVDIIETPLDKGGGPTSASADPETKSENDVAQFVDDGSSYYYYFYAPPQPDQQFCYQEDSSTTGSTSFNMVAYPYSYETQGEDGDEDQAGEEIEIGLAENAAAAAGLTGALPQPHNDLFINPAFSYLQFLSDGSVVGPMGEIYTPANYFPAHAAATAPVVDVSPAPPGSPPDLSAPGLLMQTEYGGKI